MKKSHLLRVVAHDLRNPISGILAASEYLIEDLPDASEDHLALLQAIYSSSQFMLHLIDDLLEISATGSANLEFTFQPTDLVLLVKQDVVLNRLLAERKRVRMVLAAHGTIPLVPADPQKIYQVIDKLVTNAIKFSHPDSGIEIQVGVEDDSAIVSVRDHGTGFPAEELKRVLRPFPSSQSLDQLGPAPAYGLPHITRIVEEHGGHVRVESELGQGSTFTVSLPLTQASSLPSSGPGRTLFAPGSR
jgi:signal transduction histidine kinase